MGHRIIETAVYSCESCGWIGATPQETAVAKLEPGEMGYIVRGSRKARVTHRYDCPVCQSPIHPSPPVSLLDVEAIDRAPRQGNSGATEP
jgi:predicted RNA-binding Zn-ribbon protein involved in translation (DUF1610 family)